MMDLNMQKEPFSRAYVQAVAACCGFAWSEPSVDDDSVDMTLHQTGGEGSIRSPRLELQLKCKAATMPTNDPFSFSLKIKNYDDLRDPNVLVPRILVVVLVPDELEEWLSHSEGELAVRRCGYWVSLRGLPPSENQSSQTVPIPRAQQFTVDGLRGMMERIGQGDSP